MANIYIPAVRGLAVKAGIQVGILVNDWMNTDINTWKDVRTPLSYDESTGGVSLWENNPESLVSHAEGSGVTKSVDFGVPVGLSYEYKNVSLDVRYYIGLTKVGKTENPDNARNRCLSITLGYRFHL